jgi:zinc protease
VKKTSISGPRFHTAHGIPVFHEPSHDVPIVDVEIIAREGALTDPIGREGLTKMSAQLMRRGTRKLSTEQIDEAVDALGASLAVNAGHGLVRFSGAVIRRNLEPFLALLGEMVTKPAMRARDFDRLRREVHADLIAVRDHDRGLAYRAFRQHLFGSHLYGRPVTGTLSSIAAITRGEILAQHEKIFTTGSLVIGVAGDVAQDTLQPLIDRAFRGVPEGSTARVRLGAPRLARGRRVLVVDKPERTQTQVYAGTLCIKAAEPDFHSLLVSNTAFGGSFTSRLMQEVRVKRGWSYGTGSKVGVDRQREAWTMWTHPSSEQLLDCLALELDLMDKWVDRGLSAAELRRAKKYLIKSHAFDLDTAAKRLEPQLDTELYDLPPDWHPTYVQQVKAVTREGAAAAVKRHLSARDLAISIVATVTDDLLRGLRSLPGVTSVDTIPFDRL